LAEEDCEEHWGLLAECYLAENKSYKLIHLLKDCKSEMNRYRLAVAYLKINEV